jgi:hypothetical protein
MEFARYAPVVSTVQEQILKKLEEKKKAEQNA